MKNLKVPNSAILGRKAHQVNQICLLFAEIEGHSVDLQARVIDEIGSDEDGRTIDIILGALAMQEWGIRLDVPNDKLDWSRYTTDFVEY